MSRDRRGGDGPVVTPLSMSDLAAITVTYDPDHELLASQWRALGHVSAIFVVDNASSSASRALTRALVSDVPQAVLIENERNVGLGDALNTGIAAARAAGKRVVLLLDQDSTFAATAPAALLRALNDVQATTGIPCCVGPVLVDPQTGMAHGFHHVADGWLWARAHPATDAPPIPVANLNGSGTMMPIALVDTVGGLDGGLFIDHVDTEWSFRVLSQGFGLYGIPSVSFDHRMGERGRRVWLLGWRVWPDRSPLRHYYLYRNTVRLMRRPYVWRVWKCWALAKMLLTLCVVIAAGPSRREQWQMIMKGLKDGFREWRRD